MHLTTPIRIEKNFLGTNKVYLIDSEDKPIMCDTFKEQWQYDLLEEMVRLFNNKVK